MEIIVDQRIELLGVIQTLCGYWDYFGQKYLGKTHYQCTYKDEVIKYFEKYKKHETLKLYNHLCKEDPDISHYFQFILILGYSELPELNCITNYDNDYYFYLSQKSNWKAFAESMKTFYKDTNFKDFFYNNKNKYEKLLSDFGNKDELINWSNLIFNYLSINNDNNYKIIISSLIMGCYGIKIKINEILTMNYPILSPNDYKNNKYLFDYGEPINHVLWHEISHTVINDLTGKYIDNFDVKNIEIPEKIKNIGYTNIKTVIDEYIIRTIVYLLTELSEGDKSAVLQYEYEFKLGFTEIENIKEYIKENCEENNKLLKDDNYIKLIKYVIEKIKN